MHSIVTKATDDMLLVIVALDVGANCCLLLGLFLILHCHQFLHGSKLRGNFEAGISAS
jgi:hypothetical protein